MRPVDPRKRTGPDLRDSAYLSFLFPSGLSVQKTGDMAICGRSKIQHRINGDEAETK